MKKRKPIYFLFCEGKDNKTELLYFGHFNGSSHYALKIKPSSHNDLKGMLDYALNYCRNNGYDPRFGDRIFLLTDIDTSSKRTDLLKERVWEKPKYKQIKVIFSYPSFELWFLNHFEYSTRRYHNQDELIDRLKTYIRSYEKQKDVFNFCGDYRKAIMFSKKQCEQKDGDIWPLVPFTYAYELVEFLILERGKEETPD